MGLEKIEQIKERRVSADRSSGTSPASGLLRPSLLLFAVLLIPSIHALPWQGTVAAALMINLLVLVLLLVGITVLRLEQFRNLLYDEFGQLGVTLVLVVLLIAGLGEVETIGMGITQYYGASACVVPTDPSNPPPFLLTDPIKGIDVMGYAPFCATGGGSTILEWAKKTVINHEGLLTAQIQAATVFNAKVGATSAVSGFCNLMGTGLSVAGCSGYGVLRGPTGQMITASGIALMELKAEQLLLAISSNFALTLLLPLGILMRCLHFTRKAGGTIIAIALALAIVMPMAILLTQATADYFVRLYDHYSFERLGYLGEWKDPSGFEVVAPMYPNLDMDVDKLMSGDPTKLECNPYEPDVNKMVGRLQGFYGAGWTSGQYHERPDVHLMMGVIGVAPTPLERLLFLVLGRTLLMGALVLTMTILSVRVLGRMFGTEIEVWTIARLS